MSSQRAPRRFVDDLVPIILENDDHWWPRDFVRLALVSPAWLGPVRRRLYARPTLDSFRACNLFARSLADNPNLLQHIHALNLRPIANQEVAAGGGLFAEDMASLRRILGLDNLCSLTLGGELAVGAERFLHSLASSQTITELHIDGTTGNWGCGLRRCTSKPASLEWDHIIAFRFPNLTKLTLTDIELDIVHPPMPYALKIRELTLDKVHITGGFLPDLANESWSHLQSLNVVARKAADFDEHIRLTLECCADSLRSLYYEIRDCSRDDGIFDSDLEPCPSLQELRLSGVEMCPETLAVIGRLFQNLEGLSIMGRNSRVTPEEWRQFIESRTLPSLRELHLPSGNLGPPFMYWSEEMGAPIREACGARNMTLQCSFLPDKVYGARYGSPF